METIGAASGMVIDGLLLLCLLIAIAVGGTLLWQISTLRRERFRFDQMTQALSGQLSIFQAAMNKGRDDIEVKITRLNKALSQGRDLADELHILIEAAQNAKTAVPTRTSSPPRMAAQLQPEPVERMERRPMFAIVDPEFTPEIKEDAVPAMDDFTDLTDTDRAELSQLGTQAERALMAALKRAGRR